MNPGAEASTQPAIFFGAGLRFWLQLGFISFGGPWGESTRGNLKLTAPLALVAVAAGLLLRWLALA
jgi:hypothetical protein